MFPYVLKPGVHFDGVRVRTKHEGFADVLKRIGNHASGCSYERRRTSHALRIQGYALHRIVGIFDLLAGRAPIYNGPADNIDTEYALAADGPPDTTSDLARTCAEIADTLRAWDSEKKLGALQK